VGPGEDRIAFVLGGEVQGGNVSYDILDPEGQKWEIKEPSPDGTIRPGTEGKAAISKTRNDLEDAVRKLRKGLNIVQRSADVTAILSKENIEMIRDFLIKDEPMIKKGEVSKGRIERLRNILNLIKKLIDENTLSDDQKKVEMGDEDHTVSQEIGVKTYIKLGHELNLSKKDLKVDDKEIFASVFNHEPFNNPDDFIDEVWKNAAKASDVFGHTAGVILVHPDGFRIIKNQDLDKNLLFSIITQGTAKFKVTK